MTPQNQPQEPLTRLVPRCDRCRYPVTPSADWTPEDTLRCPDCTRKHGRPDELLGGVA